MKALSLTQPWATLVVLGLKRVETRSWWTSHRGPLAIHAAKVFPTYAREFADDERRAGRLDVELPLGSVLGVVNVAGCRRTEIVEHTLTPLEQSYGDYSPGRWAWLLDQVLQVFTPPIPARGALHLWDWTEHPTPTYVNPQLSLLD